MKLRIFNRLSVISACLAVMTAYLASCSGQSDVNAFISSMDSYAQNLEKANSLQEVSKLDHQYAATVSEYADSKTKLTDADRSAIMKAIVNLSTKANKKIGQLQGFEQNISDSLLNARADEFRAAIDRCNTLGEVIRVGL